VLLKCVIGRATTLCNYNLYSSTRISLSTAAELDSVELILIDEATTAGYESRLPRSSDWMTNQHQYRNCAYTLGMTKLS